MEIDPGPDPRACLHSRKPAVDLPTQSFRLLSLQTYGDATDIRYFIAKNVYNSVLHSVSIMKKRSMRIVVMCPDFRTVMVCVQFQLD